MQCLQRLVQSTCEKFVDLSAAMMRIYVVTCVAMLPALVVAEKYSTGGCDANFDTTLDPTALTPQGPEILTKFGAVGESKMYLWDPSTAEKSFTTLRLALDIKNRTFSFSYKKNRTAIIIKGNATYQFTPKVMLKLQTATKTADTIFSFDATGLADLYPVYITDTEIALKGCYPSTFGKMETLYVLTNEDFSTVNATCAIAKIKNAYNTITSLAPA